VTFHSAAAGSRRRFFEMPGSNGNLGKLAAYDVDTLEEVRYIRPETHFRVGRALSSTGGSACACLACDVYPLPQQGTLEVRTCTSTTRAALR
jgi:hypothetical protein